MVAVAEVSSAAELVGRYRSVRSKFWPSQPSVVALPHKRTDFEIILRNGRKVPKTTRFEIPHHAVLRGVLEESGLTFEDLASPSRKANIVYWRAVYVNRLRDMNWRVTRIGRHLNRDHTTIIHILKVYANDSLRLQKLRLKAERLYK